MDDLLLAAAAVALLIVPAIARYRLRRAARLPLSALVAGIEAGGSAAMGVTGAAVSSSSAAIAGGAMIAFAAIVQQYCALVYASIAKRNEALVGAPRGFAATLGILAYVLLGSPPLV